jgi:pimeloyl-ACP methyl ester carboxylesterase
LGEECGQALMTVLNALLVAAGLYAAAVAGLYLAQDSLIFPRYMVRPSTDPLPAGTERLELHTPEGVRLVGNLVRARSASRGLLLGFAGNAWNTDDFTGFLARRLPDLDIAAFHYRGYAPSEGRPSEAALRADAAMIRDRLVQDLRPRRVLLAGFSLGSGVAAALAHDRGADGLLLVTPFDSIEAVARAQYPWVPVSLLLRHRFRSDLHLAGLDIPAAVIAASDDSVVPEGHSKALTQALRRSVFTVTVPGSTHNGLYHMPEIDAVLRQAVEALLAS